MAPDYVLVTRSRRDELVRELGLAIRDFYGADPRASPDYGRIVDHKHFDHLIARLDPNSVILGGQADRAERYFEPTLVDGSDFDSPLMRDEIFGPILPIVEVEDGAQARAIVSRFPKPLVIYLFTSDHEERRRWVDQTSSGTVSWGSTVAFSSIPSLPFGGVGSSGMGRYHGVHSLRTFSNEKALIGSPLQPDTLAMVYPPNTSVKPALGRLLRGVTRPRLLD